MMYLATVNFRADDILVKLDKGSIGVKIWKFMEIDRALISRTPDSFTYFFITGLWFMSRHLSTEQLRVIPQR